MAGPWAVILAVAGLAVGCARVPASEPLLVFAAASLADVMTEMSAAFEAPGGQAVRFSFAGSNTLARQIEAGAPADLFLSADREQVARLEAAGRVEAGAASPFAANTLVVIARAGEQRPIAQPNGLLVLESLALADPDAVPAGVYARRWMESEGLWEPMKGRVIPTLDVRAALAAVTAGNAQAAIVYATDAAGDPRVETIYRPPLVPANTPRYWAAPIEVDPAAAAHPSLAPFLDLLRGAKGAEILAAHGFLPEPAAREGA